MFCNQCGTNNIDTSKFCSNCGTQLITTLQPQPQPQPQPQQIQRQIPELWNPNAAANWSLLFSPAFGAYLHMKNWEALNQRDKVKSSYNWFIASIILSILGLGFFVLVAWYFSLGKKQAIYIKERFGDHYSRKSWGIPLLIGFSIFIVSIILIMLIPENTNNHSQQITNQQEQISQNNKNQKPWEMDWDNAKAPTTAQQESKNNVDWNQYPLIENTETVQDSTQTQTKLEQAHYDAILKVHPDALQIVKQPSFQAWIDSQSPEWRKYYNDVADTGNADQVIELLNDYKNNLIH